MKRLALVALLCWLIVEIHGQQNQEIFDFEFEGVTLNGVINMPTNQSPKGIVLMTHGSGRTNAVAQNLHGDVRAAIVKAGYATYIWDKMGCGKSGGTFNYNQTVHSSAMEAIAAIHKLQQEKIPGSDKIGLWGISRAGWINPIIINEYKDILFWVSVSGVDEKENFKYLLDKNLTIDGHPKAYVDLIIDEWVKGNQITHSGGSYESFLSATKNLRKNEFLNRFNNGNKITKSGYYAYQKGFMKEAFENETGLQIYIDNFEAKLSQIEIPVLALFGEKDMNVDWMKTASLYKRTLGRKNKLTIHSFPDGNHNLFKCETGGFFEFQDNNLPWVRSEGYLAAITSWLNKLE